jgi:hypothetical protein
MSKKVEQAGAKMGSVVLRSDTCASSFQDATFGRNVRVHNVGKGKIRCTVCSREVVS